jgi:4-hydroxybenzoyl-CoA reductase subunit beta
MLRLHEYAYHRPRSLADAIGLLVEHPDAIPIAGGTDLVPNMKHALFTPRHLVALKGVAGLDGVTRAGDDIVLGACTTLAAAARDPLVRRHLPSLAEAAGRVAGPQIRNQGTVGGNLCLDTRCTYYNQSLFWRRALGYCLKKDGDVCHVTRTGRKCVAANSADTVPALMTLGAVVDLASADGERSVPVAEFFVADGIRNTVRRRDELVVRIRVPIPPRGSRAAYVKVRQRGSIDFPLLSIAAAAEISDDGTVQELRLVVSALGARPRTVGGLDAIAAGRPLVQVSEAVARQAWKQCHPLENLIVDPEWRRAMVPVYVRRALASLAGPAAATA